MLRIINDIRICYKNIFFESMLFGRCENVCKIILKKYTDTFLRCFI